MSEMFYRAVVHAVLIFGEETWILLAAMSRKTEGMHLGFFRQVTGKKDKCQRGKTWRSAAAAKVLKESGTQTLGEYIDKRQATVTEWVLLRPILDTCDMETGYERGGRRHEPW